MQVISWYEPAVMTGNTGLSGKCISNIIAFAMIRMCENTVGGAEVRCFTE
jgi:hypothetical protein